jgi:hypothetical protein
MRDDRIHTNLGIGSSDEHAPFARERERGNGYRLFP